MTNCYMNKESTAVDLIKFKRKKERGSFVITRERERKIV